MAKLADRMPDKLPEILKRYEEAVGELDVVEILHFTAGFAAAVNLVRTAQTKPVTPKGKPHFRKATVDDFKHDLGDDIIGWDSYTTQKPKGKK